MNYHKDKGDRKLIENKQKIKQFIENFEKHLTNV